MSRQHVRSKIVGTASKPRLSVFRSSKHIYAQLIDDLNGVTWPLPVARGKGSTYGGNVKAAEARRRELAEAAKKRASRKRRSIAAIRFHGRIQALAVAATKAGLKCCVPKTSR